MTSSTSDSTRRRTVDARPVRAQSRPDGSHESVELSAAVARGELLRIRRGVYFDAEAWLTLPPWDRHLVATAATALHHPAAVFCRETALLLHGLPLPRTPDAVHRRTARPQESGRRPPGPLTGAAGPATIRRLLDSPDDGARPRTRGRNALQGFALQRSLAPEWMRRTGGTTGAPVSSRVPDGDLWRPPSIPVQLEPLPQVLLDTVPRLGTGSAVGVLDALGSERLAPHLPPLLDETLAADVELLPRRRARRWQQLHAFADPRAESVGESVSRVLIAELGFAPPELQIEFRLPDGRLARADFYWPEAGLVGEFDGEVKYSRAQDLTGLDPADAVIAEKRREDGLRALGHGVARWGWAELREPRALRSILHQAGAPRG